MNTITKPLPLVDHDLRQMSGAWMSAQKKKILVCALYMDFFLSGNDDSCVFKSGLKKSGKKFSCSCFFNANFFLIRLLSVAKQLKKIIQ